MTHTINDVAKEDKTEIPKQDIENNPYAVRWGTRLEVERRQQELNTCYRAVGHDYDPYK